MKRVLEFFFDYGSPFSYLADTQLAGVARRTNAAIAYRPMLLGAEEIHSAFERAGDGA